MTDIARRESEILLYTAPDGAVKVGVLFRDETAWLTQRSLAELFGVGVPAVNKHLKNIFESGELDPAATVSKMEMVRSEGRREVTREVEMYNLDAIIAVGYRVNSYQATQFRIWATSTLREFIVKGFVLDDERMKQGKTVFGKDYFDDLLERIREIRSSERRFYQKVTDIYALAADYDTHAPLTSEFFASVQNKLHWAITGQTAAELIYASADATKLFMGLSTWKHAPRGKVLKADVAVTFDNGIKRIYVDGTLTGMASSTPSQYDGELVRIGCEFDRGNRQQFVKGQLDDVRFYVSALSAAEIALLAQ